MPSCKLLGNRKEEKQCPFRVHDGKQKWFSDIFSCLLMVIVGFYLEDTQNLIDQSPEQLGPIFKAALALA